MPNFQPADGRIIGIDTGGTFTDVTMMDPESGEIWVAKTSSTPDDPSEGFGNGVGEVLGLAGATAESVVRVLHGTTVATNLILEAKGPACAMLVTAGFRSVLEIGRQDIPRGGSLFAWVKPRRPIPPENIWEVAGRIDVSGAEVAPLDEVALRRAAQAIAAEGIQAVAVVFLHSYANPAHERRTGEILAEEIPDAMVSLSSEVLPVFREYERSMTTVLNVYVMPAVSSYVARLEDRLAASGIRAPLLLMKSNGGVAGARTIRRTPVETALSGPAAGVVGTRLVGESAGFQDLIGIDIGGTSADISLIHRGEPSMTSSGRIGNWPIGRPIVDITTIGAGGGSIARVAEGRLTVGPQSAGARPGPVCYGRGGTEPTVTDAHLVLGHLVPHLLGGSFVLDTEAARQAIEARVARPLYMGVEEAARGILAVADHAMAGAIRVVSVERGHDPRDFVLVPFGGAGPLHGGALARLMGMRRILVPPSPGVLSAIGLLVSDLRAEFTLTCLQQAGAPDLVQLGQVFAELERGAEAWLAEEGVPPEGRMVNRRASLRYRNQGFELLVPWPAGPVDEAGLTEAVQAFHRLHERLYTFAQPDTPVEVVTLQVDAVGRFPRPSLTRLAPAGPLSGARTGETRLALESGERTAPVYDRARLGAGAVLEGPAVITQLDTTTLLLPGQVCEVHPGGSLIVEDHQG
jgi:N-methylhydantoinase A